MSVNEIGQIIAIVAVVVSAHLHLLYRLKLLEERLNPMLRWWYTRLNREEKND